MFCPKDHLVMFAMGWWRGCPGVISSKNSSCTATTKGFLLVDRSVLSAVQFSQSTHTVSERDPGMSMYFTADLYSQWSLSWGFQTAGSLGYGSSTGGMGQNTAKRDKLLRKAVEQKVVSRENHLTLQTWSVCMGRSYSVCYRLGLPLANASIILACRLLCDNIQALFFSPTVIEL